MPHEWRAVQRGLPPNAIADSGRGGAQTGGHVAMRCRSRYRPSAFFSAATRFSSTGFATLPARFTEVPTMKPVA